MTTNDSKINQLFNQLDGWRHLPAYQLERRADIFFSLYLPEVLQKKFKLLEAPILIPEFPVRYGSVRKSLGLQENDPNLFGNAGSNQSFKIDYLAVSKDEKRAFFVELKTDNDSVSSDQIKNMECASKAELHILAEGVRQIHAASNAHEKYKQLLMQTASLESWKITPLNVFILPEIQPENLKKIREISPRAELISFCEVADIVEKHSDYLSLRFANSLRKWAAVKAGSKQ